MSKKETRSEDEGSWVGAVFAAVLSVGLGAMVAATILVLRPVVAVAVLPKIEQIDPKAVYYLEGLRDAVKASSAVAKRKAFAEGKSIVVTEQEINSLLASAPSSVKRRGAAIAPGAKAGAADQGKPRTTLFGYGSFGDPLVRIREGNFSVGLPLTIEGLDRKIIVQAHGSFQKSGNTFSFAPATLYLGSLPVHRVPFLANYLVSLVLTGQEFPADIKSAWPGLTAVTLAGDTLKLAMP